MLEAVHIYFAVSQSRVGGNIVAEFDDLYLQAVLLSNLLYLIHYLGMGAGSNADLQWCVILRRFLFAATTSGKYHHSKRRSKQQ